MSIGRCKQYLGSEAHLKRQNILKKQERSICYDIEMKIEIYKQQKRGLNEANARL
jgi:hypothetical protein